MAQKRAESAGIDSKEKEVRKTIARKSVVFALLGCGALASLIGSRNCQASELYLEASYGQQKQNVANSVTTLTNTQILKSNYFSMGIGKRIRAFKIGLRFDYLNHSVQAGVVTTRLIQLPVYLMLARKIGRRLYLEPELGGGYLLLNKLSYTGLPSCEKASAIGYTSPPTLLSF